MRHPFTAIVITQQLRVDRDRLDKTAHPLGALAQPDIGTAGVTGGAIFAAAYELLEQGEGKLWGQAIELLNGPDQIALTRNTNECGVKIDAGQRVGEKVDTLPQGLFRQRQSVGLAAHRVVVPDVFLMLCLQVARTLAACCCILRTAEHWRSSSLMLA
ncbi:hypothetical protein D3C73_753590 [compost metagenome]